MPNHIHGIVVIDDKNVNDNVGDAYMRPLRHGEWLSRSKMLLSKIVHDFKTAVTRDINQIQNHFLFQWQRSFHDHIIRNEHSYIAIKEYIRDNPVKWEMDTENPHYPINQAQKIPHQLTNRLFWCMVLC